MDPSGDLDPLLRRAEALFLAGRDFWDVGVVVDHLRDAALSDALPPQIRHTLEVGMIVTYCRPFSGSSSQTISQSADLSPELSDFHKELIRRRHTVYAHTDHTNYRRARNFRSREEAIALLKDFEEGVVHEEWDSLTDDGLSCLRELATHHHQKVSAELDRLRARYLAVAEQALKQTDNSANH